MAAKGRMAPRICARSGQGQGAPASGPIRSHFEQLRLVQAQHCEPAVKQTQRCEQAAGATVVLASTSRFRERSGWQAFEKGENVLHVLASLPAHGPRGGQLVL